MAKNIVFCADGTWNGPGDADTETQEVAGSTNVLKTFVNLAGKRALSTLKLSDEEESSCVDDAGQLLQIAKYLNGVGDSDNFLVKVLGGALGAGLVTRIVRGYTFISRNYCAGDRIYLVGFSRGAYTARALAGLICSQGLIDATKVDLVTDKDVAYRWGSAVWYASRKHALKLKGDETLLSTLENLVLDLPRFLLSPPPPEQMIDAPITAIGVWDTVGSLGIPQYNLKTGEHIEALRFTDTQLSNKVGNGYHAVSLDERRGDFTPTLWIEDRPGIRQRLFPGAHADVGGGYPEGAESGLSGGSLAWMTQQLSEAGVLYAGTPLYLPVPDATGTAHAPWEEVPWKALPQSPRVFPELLRKDGLDRSITLRMKAGPVLGWPSAQPGPYAPGNLL
ncbi:MAG TPA: DUF2235 domain-containing protein [Burkholderiaceae bacterium]|jgi:uncharacterized protein (DUF2235 family)